MVRRGRSASRASATRKDIRNAVEAAHKASGWGAQTGHNRAQVLYFLGENLSARAREFEERLRSFGQTAAAARSEVETALRRIFWYAAQADKFDGAVHATKSLTCDARHERTGRRDGDRLPDGLSATSASCRLSCRQSRWGNRVVAVPSQSHPLASTDSLPGHGYIGNLPGGAWSTL